MDNSVHNRAEAQQPRAEHHGKNNNNNKKKKLNNNNNIESSPASAAAAAAASPPSASSSPSHEFSFTISLHSSNPNNGFLPGPADVPDRSTTTKTPNNSFAIDLSPADDIFFHGHLLPLHLLSHLPPSAASPRSSTNSLDSFTLPIKDLILDDQKNNNPNVPEQDLNRPRPRPRPTTCSKSDSKIAHKSKSFSLFGMPRWRKVVTEVQARNDASTNPNPNTNNGKTRKKKSKKNLLLDDASQLLKRYIRMVRPLLFLKRKNRDVDRDDDIDLELEFNQQQHSSFSGNLSARRTNKNEFHVRTGGRGTSELFSSAPASMRTSPTNSGLLVPSPTASIRSNDSSTMEELQAAIQAAIAHCKNSIAAAEGKAVKA
ncbi:BRI1 kinase inhibitor 1 [Punica granatum]|uniref:Uncharacterized protein n=2 Tax=Punica granatum TaxID=22663 RepID=A0A218WDC9_PUNGR|nr:BRI1 kinase inhibitor 1 [Punica granatum]OWM70887.1 hypothetical protein CDL15_Pgr014560 [Punica granatum]PKI69748.1 hypothetical protein CRG98_009904 [Punica granatum]